MNPDRSLILGTLLAALMTGGLVAGCNKGPRHADLREQVYPRYQALRAELRDIADRLEDLPVDDRRGLELEPAPEYFMQGWEIPNTDVLMHSQLRDPEAPVPDYDLELSHHLISAIKAYGSETIPTDTWFKKPIGTGAVTRQEKILAMKYLGVIRILEHEPAYVVLDDKEKVVEIGGHVRLAGYLVDMDTKDVLTSFVTSVTPDRSFNYIKSRNETKMAALTRGVKVSMRVNAKFRFMEGMEERTNGRFAADE